MSAKFTQLLSLVGGLLVAASLGSCSAFSGNPIQDLNESPLGEDYALYEGSGKNTLKATEYHRGGQPCVTCHGTQGSAAKKFLFAGTIYYGVCKCYGDETARKACEAKGGETCNRIPAVGAKVRIFAGERAQYTVETNCAGNFFFDRDKYTKPPFDISFPALVTVATSDKERKMQGHIGREGSCAGCHESPPNWNQPGQVAIYDDNKMIPAEFQDTPGNRANICKTRIKQKDDVQ
jgi:hypothetical protein